MKALPGVVNLARSHSPFTYPAVFRKHVMKDTVTLLDSHAGLLLLVGGAVVCVLMIFVWLRWLRRDFQLIGGLALRAHKRPKARDWRRLNKAIVRTGSQRKLAGQLADLERRYGENAIRCGHLACFWSMTLGQSSWDRKLPDFSQPGPWFQHFVDLRREEQASRH